ncbi:hypothetical protein IAU60_001694 [Kwoniella sp. DSM 27419]
MNINGPDPELVAATNFRSVRRSDPAVKAILETSVYSVLYHYDESSGKWEKQKQEGPLFVVQREKAPEWALYMLNRQAVKNPSIQLVPGEMKMTVVDQGMLQVARRGERLRLGIWFSEGPEAVERFRQTILGICGEPSKRPDAVPGAIASPPVISPQPQLATGAGDEDGLSRLFAGLMKSPPVQSPLIHSNAQTPQQRHTPQPPTAQQVPTPSQHVFSPEPLAVTSPAPPVPQIQTPTSSLPLTSPLPAHVQPPPPISSPPGQTADDLLMSILGLAPPSLPPPQTGHPVAMPQPPKQAREPSPQPPQPPHPLPSHHPHMHHGLAQPQTFPGYPLQQHHQHALPQLPPHQMPHPHMNPSYPQQAPPHNAQSPPMYRNKVGDATFAQTAAQPMPVPPHPPIPSIPAAPGEVSAQSAAPVVNGTAQARGFIADAVIAGVKKKENEENGSVPGLISSAQEGKSEFRRRLTELILTDERFVDELWTKYLEQASPAGSRSN